MTPEQAYNKYIEELLQEREKETEKRVARDTAMTILNKVRELSECIVYKDGAIRIEKVVISVKEIVDTFNKYID